MSIRLTLLRDLWLYKLLPRSRRPVVLLGGYYEEKVEVEADWLAAPFILLRRRVFLESGGFNEAIFPEDSEWGIRMSRAGHKIVYAPQLGFAYHTGGTGNNPDALRIHHIAGLKAYALLNGRGLAACYWCAQLLGACIRWSVYRAALCSRANSFYASQSDLYREILSIYATIPGRAAADRLFRPASAGTRPSSEPTSG
jgi:GT2 family glycosyltransferase